MWKKNCSEVAKKSNEIVFLKTSTVVTELFVIKTRLPKIVIPAIEKVPTFIAVKIFGLVADWNCFSSEVHGVARITGVGDSI